MKGPLANTVGRKHITGRRKPQTTSPKNRYNIFDVNMHYRPSREWNPSPASMTLVITSHGLNVQAAGNAIPKKKKPKPSKQPTKQPVNQLSDNPLTRYRAIKNSI